MFQVQKILFPLDFSERCRAVAPLVAATAQHFSAKLSVLHVMQIPPPWYGETAAAQLATLVNIGQLKEEMQIALEAYLRHELKGVKDVEGTVVRGLVDLVITDYAREKGVDLIMMPTHGYGPFRRFLLGSVTAKVLHDAECPVWTDVHEDRPFAKDDCRSVLCAVDPGEENVRPIEWAGGFARSYGAELTLVHVIPGIVGPPRWEASRLCQDLIESAREQVEVLRKRAGVSARICIEGADVAEGVRSAAVQNGADLVVIGQGRMQEALGRLRTNAYAIISKSPCPVVRV